MVPMKSMVEKSLDRVDLAKVQMELGDLVVEIIQPGEERENHELNKFQSTMIMIKLNQATFVHFAERYYSSYMTHSYDSSF